MAHAAVYVFCTLSFSHSMTCTCLKVSRMSAISIGMSNSKSWACIR